MPSMSRILVITLASIGLVLGPVAEASRLGNGQDVGMSRSVRSHSPQNNPQPFIQQRTRPSTQARQNPTIQRRQQQPGLGTALTLGAAGAAGGYLLGQSINKSNRTGDIQRPADANANRVPEGYHPYVAPQQQRPQPQTGGGPSLLSLLVLAAAGYLFFSFFRRKKSRHAPGQNPRDILREHNMHKTSTQVGTGKKFPDIPTIGQSATSTAGTTLDVSAGDPANLEHLPDGTDRESFLRQAKASFLHMQGLNQASNVEEIKKYMTPGLFQAVKQDILNNNSLADFQDLECFLLGVDPEGDGHVASVLFRGKVSESVGEPVKAFEEVWHYFKKPGDSRWLVAGIQQGPDRVTS